MAFKLCLVVHEKWLKIYFWSNRWCFLGVSKKTIVVVTFNMLSHDEKSFFRSQKYHKLIYLWGSMPLKLCLIVHEKWLKNILGVIGDVSYMFSRKLLLQPHAIWYCMMEIFFRSQKYNKLIYLWGSMALKLYLIVHEKWLNIYFGSDMWCFLYVFKKTILRVIFNMLLHDGKKI